MFVMRDIIQILKQNDYPGRGILLGVTPGGAALMLYFIMGRSENSRNRVFTETQDGIVTEAADPEKLTDPSLILYAPVRTAKNCAIVTNGDQTDTIYNALTKAQSFEDALRTRTFEPDKPNYTPRISGLLGWDCGRFSYKLSILKSQDGDPESVLRFFFDYAQPKAGKGHFIHTYAGNGDPLPSFCGEPVCVDIPENVDAFINDVWSALNGENRVSLFARTLSPEGGAKNTILNRFDKVETI
jgi:IMP cyclohydrolase